MHKQEHDISVLADALFPGLILQEFNMAFPSAESDCHAHVYSTSIASISIQQEEER